MASGQRWTVPAGNGGSQPPRAAERILGVARDLFYREGIRAVGVDEIVRQAGVTKPSLYRSFPSKDELAASYLQLIRARVLGPLRQCRRRPSRRSARARSSTFLTGVGKRAAKRATIAAAA